jgi:hypothetical protein
MNTQFFEMVEKLIESIWLVESKEKSFIAKMCKITKL